MIMTGAAALLLLAIHGASAESRAEKTRFAQVTVRQQIIIRVPRGARQVVPTGASLIHWREEDGPRCVSAESILGATMLGPNSVDLVMRDNSRVRAELENRCPALDYYYGFYVDATEDGRICAGRDFIRSRVGGECRIDEFHALRPVTRP